MLAVREGVVNEVPEAKEDPPAAFAYQSILAEALGVAVSVVVPGPHTCPPVLDEMVGAGFTVKVTVTKGEVQFAV